MSVQAITCAMALRSVSPSEKLLLLALANYADEQMQCWPSQRRLADDTCLTDRTVRSLLSGLEQRGIISRTERMRDDNSRTTDVITLHFHSVAVQSISGGAETISGGVRKQFPGGAETVSGHEPSPNHQLEPSRSADPVGFGEWWGCYPRKVAKAAARKAYKAALKHAAPERLLAALKAHEFSPDVRYQPHPATWLNHGHWEDEAKGATKASEPYEPASPAVVADRIRHFRETGEWRPAWGPEPEERAA